MTDDFVIEDPDATEAEDLDTEITDDEKEPMQAGAEE